MDVEAVHSAIRKIVIEMPQYLRLTAAWPLDSSQVDFDSVGYRVPG